MIAPLRAYFAGYDWSSHTGRLTLALFLLLFAGIMLAAGRANLPGAHGLPVRLAAYGALALLLVPVTGHILRRLNDAGHSGWWIWFCLVPFANLVLLIYLVLRRPAPESARSGGRARRAGLVLTCLLALLMPARAVWTPYQIMAGSMKPTLLPGDVVLLRLGAAPSRGDVVGFTDPETGIAYLKRIVGLPGETVAMRDGVPEIDGMPATQRRDGTFEEPFSPQGPRGLLPRCANSPDEGEVCEKMLETETLPGGRGYHVLDIGPQALDNAPETTIPESHYFMLGDNRDNSNDSRVSEAVGGIGPIPRDRIFGRADLVLFNLSGGDPRLLRTVQ